MAKDVRITPADGKIEFKDTNVLKGTIYESGGNVHINPTGTVVLGDGTPANIQIGAAATQVSFSFLGGGELTAEGNTLFIGTSGDTINLNRAGVTYNLPSNINAYTLQGNLPSAFAAASHTHTIANVSGLQTALDGKQPTGSYLTSVPNLDASIITTGTFADARIASATNWNSAYDNYITGIAVSGTSTKTITLTQRDGGTITTTFTDIDTNTTYSNATTTVSGLMSSTDKTKLDGIATGANNYSHPTGDGNLHVPATGTTNNGKVLTAGSTAGSLSWQSNIAGNAANVTGTVAIANGGTGATTAAAARTNLGLGTAATANTGDFLGASATAVDSSKLNGLSSSSYLRSDVDTTLTGTLFIDAVNGGSIAYSDSTGVYVPRPQGGSYKTSTDAHTGAITVRLPGSIPSDMLSFWVDVYDYAGNPEGESFSVYVYGYAYQTTTPWWTNVGALILSDRADKSFSVRFGWDGTNHVVCIGETNSTWNYPQVVVRDFQAGYSATSSTFDDNWSIAFLTTLPSIGQTASNNYPVARSAFQLTTARTINGTSFDGTGNITTANWGTARTLTVGNTGKSVNGSGDVSWTLAEIGALGVSANAVSATTANRLDNYGINSGSDWNTWGVYGKLVASSYHNASGANKPPIYSYGSFLSFLNSGADSFQIAIPENQWDGTGKQRAMHYRSGWNGTWSSWRQVVDIQNNVCDILADGNSTLIVRQGVGYNSPFNSNIEIHGSVDDWAYGKFRFRVQDDPESIPVYGAQFRIERFSVNTGWQLLGMVPRGSQNLEWQGDILPGLSDQRVKENVVSLTDGVATVQQINPVEFDWKPVENVSEREGHDIGFIAQQLETIVPEAVYTRGDGYKTVRYDKLTPLLVQAIKEQQEMIEQLKLRIEKLELK